MIKRNVRWRTIPYTYGFYQISEYGDLRKVSKHTKHFNVLTLSTPRYETLSYEKKTIHYNTFDIDIPILKYKTEIGTETKPVASLMYEAFHGIYNIPIDNILHLDGNEFNNELSNLILSPYDDRYRYAKSKAMNQFHHFLPTVINNGSKVYTTMKSKIALSEYSSKGILTKVYPGIVQACKELEMDRNQMYKALNGIKELTINGNIYKLGYGPEFIDTHLIQKRKLIVYNTSSSLARRLVLQYANTGKLNYVYNNILEATVYNNVCIEKLKEIIQCNGLYEEYIWMYE